ncbi:hypothetical protein COCOR_07331 [Corallococcus coralloides DSM 2259]|uniref:Lipoprotein n=1 Tax=Corallococcus coralloides (strain ATCC 25202 / DSM 2259 / NBRC 100086 / M2) TaxID=1144275 RepID=H8ML98_CORCM|nr:hypothetical protein [Corallococcus coralloides]AFE07469.1 hypothetical protein COCOR_07331 [Corallococcus coralloides DSM 2259]
MSLRIPWMLTCCGLLAACGSGPDLVGVRTATAVRDADDRVTVTAVLTCVPWDGSPAAGDCDADGKEHCMVATWTDSYGRNSPRIITSGVQCVIPQRVEGATVVIRSSAPVPRESGLTIRLGDTPRVVIDSP